MNAKDLPDSRMAFRLGLIASLPFVAVLTLFGMVYGVIATEAGFSLTQTMAASIIVYAGAAQLTMLQLMQEGTPFFVALLTTLAVNLRMTMYSISLTPHLGRATLWQRIVVSYLLVDQAYALAFMQYEREPRWSLAAKLAYFFGSVAPLLVIWNLGSLIGALLADRIPRDLPIDFFVPIVFLALVGPMLRTWAHLAAAAVSVVGALLLMPVPWSLGLPIAGVIAMVAGAAVETMRLGRTGGAS